jgi:hypothetical protein
MTRGLFATMLERADTKEAIGLNRSRLRSTRPFSFPTDSAPSVHFMIAAGMTGRVMSGCMSFQVLVGNAWLKYSGWGSQAR